jgi:polyhydroxyalkanoate synthase subunit PhaC
MPGPVDPQSLAALNADYDRRWQALWAAVQSAAAVPPGVAAAGRAAPPRVPAIAEAPAGDRRFAAPEWDEHPYFALLKQGYLLASEYAQRLTALAPVPEPERQRLLFLTRQAIDALAPTNFPATNPDAIRQALATGGASLARGCANLAGDVRKGRISMTDETAFAVGANLAATPGHVVHRNDLVELIQYAPTTALVHRRPLVVVPPCINKYYVLDLSPGNSFVRHAVAAGHTVFMISWRNIPPELGGLDWDDYLERGVLAAIRTAREITGSPSVNALGFCVGGTLLACALAVLAARDDRSVASATLLTSLLDFAEPGDIGVYITRESHAARAPALLAGERVRGGEIAAAFASLRPNDLVWNYVVSNYLKGESPPPFDLLYWNGDSANLPGPMYCHYVADLYLDNRLREPGALTMLGERIDLGRIDLPAYVLATRDDHIVPWRGAYRTVSLLGRRPTFVLGASGHIAGVINPPDGNRRNHWVNAAAGSAADAEQWLAGAERRPGSWWPHWLAWLAPHAGPLRPAPTAEGCALHPPLDTAPGRYVREPAGPPQGRTPECEARR